MELMETACLEEYLAVAQYLAGCTWAQIVLQAPNGKMIQVACRMDGPVAAAVAALRGIVSDGAIFVDDCSVAALDAGIASSMAAAGVRACGIIAAQLHSNRTGPIQASIVLADARVRSWDGAQQAALLHLLSAIGGHAEARLARSDQDDYADQLEDAQALAHVGSWTYEPRTGRMRLSRELERMLGLSQARADISQADFLAAVHPEDRERVIQAHEAMLERSGNGVEYRLVQPSGQVRWVRERAKVRPRGHGLEMLSAAVLDITSEKRNAEMQQTLRQEAERAQQQFRAIFESSPTPYLVLTPDRYRIVAVSETYLKATMVTREQIMGREMFDAFPDDPADPYATGVAALSASLDRVRATKAPDVMAVQRYPVRRPPEQGGGFELKYWSPVNSPVLDADGNVAFIIHRVEDVTDYVLSHQAGDNQQPSPTGERQEVEIVLRSLELKRLAASLAESEQRFRYISRATNDAVWDWDIRSGALSCGESAGQALGALLGPIATLDDWLRRIDPADCQRVRTSLCESVAARREHWSEEYRLGGTEAPLEVLHRCFLILDEEGRAMRMVGSITDITERKRQEARLREQAEMLDYATDAILVRDLDNRVVYWNRAAELRYGWSAAEVMGRPVSETLYAACPKEDFDRAMQVLMRTGDFTGRIIQSARDGRRIVVHAHWILVRHQDGSPRAILSVVTDLSDKIALEQRLAEVQKLEALGRLTGGIAHDFNNWLTVIIGNAEELADELQANAPLAELADMILTAGQRAAGLTYRLLSFARRQSLEPNLLDVREVLESARPLLERSLHENIALRLRLPPSSWQVYVDRGQLEASILNLCINARDAMPQGGCLTIEVSNIDVYPADPVDGEALAPGQYVVVTVADNGFGIPHEFLDRVFEPFFTTKGESGGSGLGLSMAYGFAKQSNGNLTISSEPGQGTVVRLYLPRSNRMAATLHAARTARLSGAGRCILLVEDDPDVRRAIDARLRELGYAVTACATAEQALDILDSGMQCDLLFTDIIMPSMTGIELVSRARERHPGLRVLLSSGYPFDALQRHDTVGEHYRILYKPYGKNELIEAIQAALNDEPGTLQGPPDGTRGAS